MPVALIGYATDGKYNYKTFLVQAPEDGDYFADFWLLPAQYVDKTYTTYIVSVNGVQAGKITPMTGNWQAIQPDGDGRLHLVEGTNTIAIGTLAPEEPDVEKMKIAEYYTESKISSYDYNDYLIKAKKNLAPKPSETQSYTYNIFSNVPLKYSFYKLFPLKKDEYMTVITYSDSPHDVDVLYYGYRPILNYSNPTFPPITGPTISLPDSLINIDPTQSMKLKYTTNSEQMQGYNWKGLSEFSSIYNKQRTGLTIKAPADGHYMIRLRSRHNNVLATADMWINKRYYFEDVPVYCSYREYAIPADSHSYSCFTIMPDNCEAGPILFIHGNDADRIVGFNDDDTSEYAEFGERDSYIEQVYHVRTTGISVSNFSSSCPEALCDIIAGTQVNQYNQQRQSIKTVETHKTSYSILLSEIYISDNINQGSPIVIKSTEPITAVYIYSMTGALLYSANVDSCEIEISPSDMNILSAGVYIVNIETIEGSVSKKLIIK